MRFVHCALVAVCLTLGGNFASSTGTTSRSPESCLLTTTQASALLGGKATMKPRSPTGCTFSTAKVGDRRPFLSVFLLRTAQARSAFDETLSSKTVPKRLVTLRQTAPPKGAVVHPVTIGGGDGFYLDPIATTPRHGNELLGFMFVHKGGRVMGIDVAGTSNPTATEFAAARELLAKVSSSGTSVSFSGPDVSGPYECFPLATTKGTTTWKMVRQQCEPVGSSTTSTSA